MLLYRFRANNDFKTIKDLTEYYRRNTNLFLMNRARSLRTKLWLILDEPSSSKYAKVGCYPGGGGAFWSVVFRCVNKKTMRKGTFVLAGQCAALSSFRVGKMLFL